MTVEVADVLDKAADLIDPAKGGRWIRGQLADEDGGLCILGALGAACGVAMTSVSFIGRDPLIGEAEKTVKELLNETLAGWNDQDCIDGHEAANVLRKAAEIERGEGGRSAGNSGQYPVLPTTRPPVLMGAESG